jgi:hypothetical protein
MQAIPSFVKVTLDDFPSKRTRRNPDTERGVGIKRIGQPDQSGVLPAM